MAGAFQYATAFRGYTVTADGNAAPEHPGSNVATITRWLRTWRTVDLTATRLVLAVTGGAAAVPALFVNHANFTSLLIEGSATGTGGWSTIGTFSVGEDGRVGRRKGLFLTPTLNHAYVGLTPSSAVSGATYWELGAVALAASLTTMVQSPGGPLLSAIVEAATRIDYAGGGFEMHEDGPPRLVYQLRGGPWVLSRAVPDLVAWLRARKTAPILLYENQDDTSQAAIVQRTNDVQWARSFRTLDAEFVLEECL